MRQVVIIPRMIDTIIVDNSDKENVKALAHTPYKFDDNGECEITFEFYDGIAYDVKGTGLIMTYPKQEKVQKHSILQNCIVSYTGIDDESINQHDIALRYGKLEWKPEDSDSLVKTFTKEEFNSLTEDMIALSGDIYEKVYSIKGDYVETTATIRSLAIKFENWWNDNADEDTDFIFALEDFEEKELAALGYKELTEEDFDDEPDDDPSDDLDDEPDDDPLVEKCNNLTKAALELVDELTK